MERHAKRVKLDRKELDTMEARELCEVFKGYADGNNVWLCGTNNFVSGAPIPSGRTLRNLLLGKFGLDCTLMFVEFLFHELISIYPLDTWDETRYHICPDIVRGHLVATRTPVFGNVEYARTLFMFVEHTTRALQRLYQRMNPRDRASMVAWFGARELFSVLVLKNSTPFDTVDMVRRLCRLRQTPTLVGTPTHQWQRVFYQAQKNNASQRPKGSFNTNWTRFKAKPYPSMIKGILPIHARLDKHFLDDTPATFNTTRYPIEGCAYVCRDLVASFYRLQE